MLRQAVQRLKQFWWRYAHYRVVDLRDLYPLWEQQQLRKLFALLDVDCVLDVGANSGQYAQMIRQYSGYRGRIISFEPQPEIAAQLRKNAAEDPLWQVEEVALSDQPGEQTFNIMAGSQFSSLSAPRHDETDRFATRNVVQSQVQVQTETLAHAYRRLATQYGFERPFLKMDTQGYDVTVVRSGAEIMHRFVGLQSELAFRRLYASSVPYREALAYYESLGFTLSALVPNNEGHFPQLVESDCIMLRTDLL